MWEARLNTISSAWSMNEAANICACVWEPQYVCVARLTSIVSPNHGKVTVQAEPM